MIKNNSLKYIYQKLNHNHSILHLILNGCVKLGFKKFHWLILPKTKRHCDTPFSYYFVFAFHYSWSLKVVSREKNNVEHNSMGLNLVKRRIALLNQIYERKYTLNISENEQGQW